MILRDPTKADLPGLAQVLGDWVHAAPWMPKLHRRTWDLGVLRMPGPPATGFRAQRGGAVDALYLVPEARRRGLGPALMAKVMAVEPVMQLWTFQAKAPAETFYTALVLVETEQTDGAGNPEGLPDTRLEWRRG